jgi:polar amino acid transport system substrate-binding protein
VKPAAARGRSTAVDETGGAETLTETVTVTATVAVTVAVIRGSRRARTALAFGAALLAGSALAGCGAAAAVAPSAPGPVAHPDGLDLAMPSAAPGGSAQSCDPAAISPRPSAADASGTDVQAIKARGRLIVGVSQDEYLTGFLGPSGTEEGFDIDVARAISTSLFGSPDDIQFVAVSDADRIPDLRNGTVDLVVDTMTITCERAQQIAFSSVYYDAKQKVLVDKSSGYTSLSSLGGKYVCASSGSTSLTTIVQFPSHPKPYGVVDFSDCLVALQQNQVQAISTDDTILAGLAAQDPNTEVLKASLADEPYGIGVSLKKPDLTGYVNGVLAQLRSDGGWEKIYNQWLAGPLGPAQPPAAQYAH